MFVKNRGFTTASVLTLALGIGATTAVFSIVDTVIYRPLPYKQPGRLVKIAGNDQGQLQDDVSFADFADVRDRNRSFESVAADDGLEIEVLNQEGRKQPVLGAIVTADWLVTLGVQPVLGRGFFPDESQPGRNHVLILTDDYWRRRFNADPHAVGQILQANGAPYTIVGVLPPNVLRYSADVLTPLVPAGYPSIGVITIWTSSRGCGRVSRWRRRRQTLKGSPAGSRTNTRRPTRDGAWRSRRSTSTTCRSTRARARVFFWFSPQSGWCC